VPSGLSGWKTTSVNISLILPTSTHLSLRFSPHLFPFSLSISRPPSSFYTTFLSLSGDTVYILPAAISFTPFLSLFISPTLWHAPTHTVPRSAELSREVWRREVRRGGRERAGGMGGVPHQADKRRVDLGLHKDRPCQHQPDKAIDHVTPFIPMWALKPNGVG
jgi:hypothetical protein